MSSRARAGDLPPHLRPSLAFPAPIWNIQRVKVDEEQVKETKENDTRPSLESSQQTNQANTNVNGSAVRDKFYHHAVATYPTTTSGNTRGKGNLDELTLERIQRSFLSRMDQLTHRDSDRFRPLLTFIKSRLSSSSPASIHATSSSPSPFQDSLTDLSVLTRSSLQLILQVLGVYCTEKQAAQLFDLYDFEKKGEITLHQLMCRAHNIAFKTREKEKEREKELSQERAKKKVKRRDTIDFDAHFLHHPEQTQKNLYGKTLSVDTTQQQTHEASLGNEPPTSPGLTKPISAIFRAFREKMRINTPSNETFSVPRARHRLLVLLQRHSASNSSQLLSLSELESACRQLNLFLSHSQFQMIIKLFASESQSTMIDVQKLVREIFPYSSEELKNEARKQQWLLNSPDHTNTSSTLTSPTAADWQGYVSQPATSSGTQNRSQAFTYQIPVTHPLEGGMGFRPSTSTAQSRYQQALYSTNPQAPFAMILPSPSSSFAAQSSPHTARASLPLPSARAIQQFPFPPASPAIAPFSSRNSLPYPPQSTTMTPQTNTWFQPMLSPTSTSPPVPLPLPIVSPTSPLPYYATLQTPRLPPHAPSSFSSASPSASASASASASTSATDSDLNLVMQQLNMTRPKTGLNVKYAPRR